MGMVVTILIAIVMGVTVTSCAFSAIAISKCGEVMKCEEENN